MPAKTARKSARKVAERSRPVVPAWLAPSRVAQVLADPRLFRLALVAIVLVAALFRFQGLKWDEGRHLHPDERFLSTVTNDIKWPTTWSNYFDPATSSLSPFALPNVGLFVYGTLPVYIVKWVSIALDMNNYDEITLVGRALSGVFDIATILMLFLIARRLYGGALPCWRPCSWPCPFSTSSSRTSMQSTPTPISSSSPPFTSSLWRCSPDAGRTTP